MPLKSLFSGPSNIFDDRTIFFLFSKYSPAFVHAVVCKNIHKYILVAVWKQYILADADLLKHWANGFHGMKPADGECWRRTRRQWWC